MILLSVVLLQKKRYNFFRKFKGDSKGNPLFYNERSR